MKTFVSLFVVVLFPLASFASCPDYSGTYRFENVGPDNDSWTQKWEQTECNLIKETFMPNHQPGYSCQGPTTGLPVEPGEIVCEQPNVSKNIGALLSSDRKDIFYATHTKDGLVFTDISNSEFDPVLLDTSTLSLTDNGNLRRIKRRYFRDGTKVEWSAIGVRQ